MTDNAAKPNIRGRRQKSDRERYADALWRQGAPAREVAKRKLLAEGTPVRQRITQALDSRMLDGPEVDEELGVAEPMVDWWEEGRVVPTGDEIERLAELTQYPVQFFYEPWTPMGPAWMCADDGCR